MLVSAGFDAHERDPLASMRVTTEGYGSMVAAARDAATSGSIAFVTEGGYDLGALRDCLDASIAEIARSPSATRLAVGPRRAIELDRACRASARRGARGAEALLAARGWDERKRESGNSLEI